MLDTSRRARAGPVGTELTETVSSATGAQCFTPAQPGVEGATASPMSPSIVGLSTDSCRPGLEHAAPGSKSTTLNANVSPLEDSRVQDHAERRAFWFAPHPLQGRRGFADQRTSYQNGAARRNEQVHEFMSETAAQLLVTITLRVHWLLMRQSTLVMICW